LGSYKFVNHATIIGCTRPDTRAQVQPTFLVVVKKGYVISKLLWVKCKTDHVVSLFVLNRIEYAIVCIPMIAYSYSQYSMQAVKYVLLQ